MHWFTLETGHHTDSGPLVYQHLAPTLVAMYTGAILHRLRVKASSEQPCTLRLCSSFLADSIN